MLPTPLHSLEVGNIPPYNFSDAMAPLPSGFLDRVNTRLHSVSNHEIAKDGIIPDETTASIMNEMVLAENCGDFAMIQVFFTRLFRKAERSDAFRNFQECAMYAQRLAFAQSRRIDRTFAAQGEFNALFRGKRLPLNIHLLSDQAQRIMLGHVFSSGSVDAEDIAQFRSQPSDFYANCRAVSAQATAELLGNEECASFYAGTTLFVVKRGTTVPPFFPIDLPAYGPSRGVPLGELNANELLAHAMLHRTGEFVNKNPVTNGYLARALFVESSRVGNGFFLENPKFCDGVLIDRRKSILTVEPHAGLGMGLTLYFDRAMLERDSWAVVVPKGTFIASLCGQQTPSDKFRFDPFAIQVGRLAGASDDDVFGYESSPGYGNAKFGGVGFNANGTCVKNGAYFIATNHIYRRQNMSMLFPFAPLLHHADLPCRGQLHLDRQ